MYQEDLMAFDRVEPEMVTFLGQIKEEIEKNLNM